MNRYEIAVALSEINNYDAAKRDEICARAIEFLTADESLLAEALQREAVDYNEAVAEIDRLNAQLAAPVAPQSQWMLITKPGQVKAGTRLRFDIGNDKYSETAKLILHPGTDQEEIIYNKRQNYYLITSMAIANKGSQKNVTYLAEP
jgi:hypothetical protein